MQQVFPWAPGAAERFQKQVRHASGGPLPLLTQISIRLLIKCLTRDYYLNFVLMELTAILLIG